MDDVNEIQQVIIRYAHCVDARDFAGLDQVFTPDVRATYSGGPWLDSAGGGPGAPGIAAGSRRLPHFHHPRRSTRSTPPIESGRRVSGVPQRAADRAAGQRRPPVLVSAREMDWTGRSQAVCDLLLSSRSAVSCPVECVARGTRPPSVRDPDRDGTPERRIGGRTRPQRLVSPPRCPGTKPARRLTRAQPQIGSCRRRTSAWAVLGGSSRNGAHIARI